MESTSSNEILIETGITIEDDGAVVASLEKKLLQEEHHFVTRKSCIFRVPARIRKLDDEAFIPKAVSIGPYHHKKLEQYEAMEKCKVYYLKHFLSHRPSITLKDCVEMLKGFEEEARGCYADNIDLTSDEFVEMMMLDGCFIVEYLLRWWKPELRDDQNGNQHPLLRLAYLITMCLDDITLLENQLPFFVLEALFNLINNISDSEKLWEVSFLGLALLIYYGWDADVSNNISDEYKPIHLLDVLYGCYITSECTEELCAMKSDTIPTATQLQEAGVKIMAAPKVTPLLNVKFENGILEIPDLTVNSRLKLRFQNMVAFERCYYSGSYVLNYLRLLDHLINTPSDVLLLKDRGIIINLFGDDEEVAEMFNNIGSSVVSTVDSQYTDLYEKLNHYYANPWRHVETRLLQQSMVEHSFCSCSNGTHLDTNSDNLQSHPNSQTV
ncbi:hypothetical protein Scep_008449 [Stephania cephalantha]|uniref:Uncharacterized protein n=1 Tax=Stephania cephalantha TaxID=152367 RepID=A0AAP0PMQ5_9MAGN